MFTKKKVTLTPLVIKKTIAVSLFLFASISFVACNKEAEVFAGYIGETWFEFPADQYTFMASVKQQDDRQVIADVLWGFKYPSMQPLLQDPKMRGEFMGDWVGTDWVRIGVRVRQEKFNIQGHVAAITNNKKSLRLRDNDRYVIEEKPNEVGLYHAYLEDIKKYSGAISTTYGQNVYWNKGNNEILTFIFCQDHGRVPGAHCDQTTVDPAMGVVVSFDYDSKNLPHWQDIQNKTLTILHSFSKNKK